MTWIIKATGGYEYSTHPNGEIWGPDQSDAYRFTDHARAKRVVAKLNREMQDGTPYRVVRLRPRYVRIPLAAAKALRASVMGDRFETKDIEEALRAIDAATDT